MLLMCHCSSRIWRSTKSFFLNSFVHNIIVASLGGHLWEVVVYKRFDHKG